MVRNIVGTLLEIGNGKLPKGSMQAILEKKDRTLASPTAAANGLALMKVTYPSPLVGKKGKKTPPAKK